MNSAISPIEVTEESSSTAVSWGSIIAGALAASTLTVILMLVGSGLGLTIISPWTGSSASVTTFAVSSAVWLVVVQWLSSALGGYLTGRLRTKWAGIHTNEVFFRDTAHGFLAWALATLLVAGVLASALSSIIGSGAQAVSNIAAGVATGATSAATSSATAAGAPSRDELTGYFVDSLFRPANPAAPPANGQNDTAVTDQASRILLSGAADGEISAEDKTYLAQLVATRTGLSEADAKARVDAVIAKVEEAKTKAKQAAEAARKAGATFALVGALSMVIGAFIASAAAALGGRQRDDEEAAFLAR